MTTSAPLSNEVVARTKSAHDRAESRPFVAHLMSGSLSVRSYVAYLAALAPIYGELECQLRAAKDEASISLFDHRRLDRFDRIRSDLRGFGQDADRQTSLRANPLRATLDYVEAVTAAAVSPQRLIAHHYTRYLGDLAEGQVIARCMSQHYDVPDSLLTFYDFSDLGDLVHYRRRYKSLLDLVPWSMQERGLFICEVSRAFDLNTALFDELSGQTLGTGPTAEQYLRSERMHAPR